MHSELLLRTYGKMSMFFDFESGSDRRFRRAVDQDKADIEAFWKPEETSSLFVADDIGSLIELSTLAICMIDVELSVTGFLALSDYPPVPGVDPADWEVWIRNMFQKYYLSCNTLFIHFVSCIDSVSEYFLEEALHSVFMNDFYLQHIILVVPPTCKIDCLSKYPVFKRRTLYRYCTKGNDDLEHCMLLFVAMRQDFCPKLKVRRAVEEDNDEIVEMLDANCKKLSELYGDFYISEILSRHPDSKRSIIVAEQTDKVVGVMCLNRDINFMMLQHTYELGPYRGLVKTDYLEKEVLRRKNSLLKTFGEPIMFGRWSPFSTLHKERRMHETKFEDSIKDKDKRGQRNSNIQIRKKCRLKQRSRSDGTSFDSTKSATLVADRSLMYLMDDEPLDYEIVNIDTKLFSSNEDTSNILPLRSHRFASSFGGTTLPNRRNSSLLDLNKKELIFEGEPNAFSIELFGMREYIDERRAYDLLEAAFESLPKYDYCIIRIPCSQKAFPLLHHFCFVPQKYNICCEYALYVVHRNSVLGKFRIRKAEFADIPQIASLFNKIEGKETIWTVEHSIVYSKRHLAYVFLCGTSIIGVGILDPPEDVDLIRARFVIDKFQYQKYHMAKNGLESGVAMLKTVFMYPQFESHFALFTRELLRISGSTSLLWLSTYRDKWLTHKANALVSVMIPLPVRVSGVCGLLPEYNRAHDLLKNSPSSGTSSFSAWYISKKFSSIPRLNVDTRIVVVGASKTAISFLNNLLFGESSTYLTFTSVTLISPNGLPYLRQSMPSAEMMFPQSQLTSDRFFKNTPFSYYVNVVQASVVDINRNDKYVLTDRNRKVYYDMLFLLIGKQIQHPDYVASLMKRESMVREEKIFQYVRMDVPSYRDAQFKPQTEYDTPENVFFINTISDAKNALSFIKTYFLQFEGFKICVYGASLDAYCCIAGLLEINVSPNDIIFVEPFPPEDQTKPRIPVFCNTKVDLTVRGIFESLKITCHRGYYFDSWTRDDDDMVSSVNFVSYHQMVTVDCCAFIYYGKKDINPHIFVAINKCGIAYDGCILIDHQFRTNDTSIYSAGPATRYFRRYLASDKQPKFYSSNEIGRKLGEQIRNQLDPLFTDTIEDISCIKTCFGILARSDISNERFQSAWNEPSCKSMVPRFTKPLVWYCILPGNLQYLEVRSPGPKNIHYYIQSLEYNGYAIETYQGGYFKLHLNNQNIVNGITCITPATYSIENFKLLYGKSAVVLNNVHLRHKAGKIDDLFTFFTAPWTGFFYNDRSEELLTIIKHLRPKVDLGDTYEKILHDVKLNNNEISLETKLKVRSTFEQAQYFEAISEFVIEWIKDNDITLPFYTDSSYITESSQNIFHLPTFKKSKKSLNKMLSLTTKESSII